MKGSDLEKARFRARFREEKKSSPVIISILAVSILAAITKKCFREVFYKVYPSLTPICNAKLQKNILQRREKIKTKIKSM